MSVRLRHELKYVTTLDHAHLFLSELGPYCKPDSFARTNDSYEVASLYYDTDDLRFFWDREESVGHRRKVRLRSYNLGGQSGNLFVEIKEKHKQLVTKKRAGLLAGFSLSHFPNHSEIAMTDIINSLPTEGAEAKELDYLNSRLGLRPNLIVRYMRRAYQSIYEHDLRITFDSNLTVGGSNLVQHDYNLEKFFLSSNLGVLEIKCNANIPLWLSSKLSRHSFRQIRFSKYALGIRTVYSQRVLPGMRSEKTMEERLASVA